MIIPSIDLAGGQAVQLVGGKTLAIEAGDPAPLARRFRLAGDIAVIDLDEALGRGTNRSLIEGLLQTARCRVGGGIRDVPTALRWLDAGAEKIILGTKAVPEILEQLPRDRVLAALDAEHGEVVVKGWTEKTGMTVEARMDQIDHLVSGYLVTFVEREGRLGGIDLEQVAKLVAQTGRGRLTVAGGVTTLEELAAIDALGADAQVGMALYTDRMKLEDAVLAPMRGPGPWPVAMIEPRGRLLWVGSVDRAGLSSSLTSGLSSFAGPGLELRMLQLSPAPSREGLIATVEAEVRTTGAALSARGLAALEATLFERKANAPAGSYTHRLFTEAGLLSSKLVEEARELAEAETAEEIVHEAADVLYFALARAAAEGVGLRAIEAELDRRAKKISRRGGDKK